MTTDDSVIEYLCCDENVLKSTSCNESVLKSTSCDESVLQSITCDVSVLQSPSNDNSEYTTSDITNNSLLSYFPSSVSLDSDIVNEILQEREQLLNESINSEEVLDDVKQCVNEILTPVDGIVDSRKKLTRKRSMVKYNW